MTKRILFQDTTFRDGFQSVFGARAFTADFIPAVEAAVAAGITHFEAGGGARFLYRAWVGRRIANDAKTTAFVILRFPAGRAMNVSRPQTGPPPRAGQAAGPKGVPHDHLR